MREYSFSEVWFTLADAFVELGRLLGEEAMIPISTQEAEKKEVRNSLQCDLIGHTEHGILQNKNTYHLWDLFHK